jgi:hypothetical protein
MYLDVLEGRPVDFPRRVLCMCLGHLKFGFVSYFDIDELVKSLFTCHCEELSDEAIS